MQNLSPSERNATTTALLVLGVGLILFVGGALTVGRSADAPAALAADQPTSAAPVIVFATPRPDPLSPVQSAQPDPQSAQPAPTAVPDAPQPAPVEPQAAPVLAQAAPPAAPGTPDRALTIVHESDGSLSFPGYGTLPDGTAWEERANQQIAVEREAETIAAVLAPPPTAAPNPRGYTPRSGYRGRK